MSCVTPARLRAACWLLLIAGLVSIPIPQCARAQSAPDVVWRTPGHASLDAYAVSPNGLTVATGSADRTLKVWRLSDGALLWRQTAGAAVTGIAFTSDGASVISGASDGAIRRWQASDGASQGLLATAPSGITALAMSTDGATIITGNGSAVRTWKTSDGSAVATMSGHTGQIVKVAASPDGVTIASAAFDQTVRLWQADGTPVRSVSTPGIPRSLAISPNGSLVAAGCYGTGSVCVIRVSDGSTVATITGHLYSVDGVAFSPDGTRLAASGWERSLRIYSTTDYSIQANVPTVNSARGLVWPSADTLIMAHSWGLLTTWNATTAATVRSLPDGHWSTVRALAFDPTGQTVVSAAYDRTARVWNAADGASLRSFTAHTSMVDSIACSPDGATVVTGSRDRSVQAWSRTDGSLQYRISTTGDYNYVGISGDGKWLAHGQADGSISVRALATGDLARTLTGGNTGYVYGVRFSPDSTMLATVGYDGTVCLWRVADGTLAYAVKLSNMALAGVAFSPDGASVAVSAFDGAVSILRAADGAVTGKLSPAAGYAYGGEYSPDGTVLATVHGNGTLRLWRTSDWALLQTTADSGSPMYAVAFAPDGSTIACGTGESAVLVVRNPAFAQLATKLAVSSVSGQVGQTIALAATLTHTGGTPIVGQTVTFRVDGAAAGSGVTDGQGRATVPYTVPASGSMSALPVSAAFAGTTGFAAASGSGRVGSRRGLTSLSPYAVRGFAGQQVTLRARLICAGKPLAGGTVRFAIDGVSAGEAVTDANGASVSATIPADATPGAHNITLEYAGDANYAPASRTEAVLTVAYIRANPAISPVAERGYPGQQVTLRALLVAGGKPAVGRTLAFAVDGASAGTGVTDETGASCKWTIPADAAAGAHEVTVTFAGDAYLLPASRTGSTLTVVARKAAVGLSPAAVSGLPGQAITLSALVVSGGRKVAGLTIVFAVDGADAGQAVSDAGGASLAWTIPVAMTPGVHAVTVRFDGGANHNAAARTERVLTVLAPPHAGLPLTGR